MRYIFFFFSLGLLSKRSQYCTVQSACPFYLKKKNPVATVWSIKLLKEAPFIPLPERNIKLSVFPSDRRMEISSLSIKMFRYFISIPVGLEALTLFSVALLYFTLMCSPSLTPPLFPVCFISARGPLLVGWGCTLLALHLDGIDCGLGPKWSYRFQSVTWVIGAEWCSRLQTTVSGTARCLRRKCCRRRHFAFEGKSDKHTNRIK